MTNISSSKLRDLGTFEHLFAAYGERGAMTFSIAARIRGTLEESDLVGALAAVQARHELLGVAVAWDENGTHCFMRSNDSIPLSISKDIDTEWHHLAQAELNSPFDPASAPLVRAAALVGSRETTLILTFYHAIADGRSAVLVLNDVLAALSGSPLDATTPRDRLDQLLGLGIPRFLHDRAHSGATDQELAGRAHLVVKPATVRVLELDKDSSERLFHLAKANEVSVHAMLTTALGRALQSLDPRWEVQKLRVMSPIDLRPMLDIREQTGLFLSLSITPFEIDGLDFWETARLAKKQIAAFQTKDMASRIISDSRRRLLDDPNYGASVDRLVTQIPFDSIMTNLGVLQLPETYGDLIVEKVWGPILRSIPGQDVVAAATFAGSLSLVHTSVGRTAGLLDRMLDIMEDAKDG